jgi:WD40 repeat protein
LEGHTRIGRYGFGGVISIAISPNGRILASASYDHTARIWNLDNNQPISSPLQHAKGVYSVSFSADGKLLATSCWDNNAYAWDVSAIIKEAGLDELLLDKRKKSVLAVRNTFITRFHCIQTISRLMLHSVQSVSQSRSTIGYPKDFSTAHHMYVTHFSSILLFFLTSMFSAFCTSRSPRYITTQRFSLG